MRPVFLSLCVLLGACRTAPGDDGVPESLLETLKAATVFVKVRSGGVSATGSGFLLYADATSGLVVTNEHVVRPEDRQTPAARPFVSVVFYSGRRKDEKVVAGEVISVDKDRDLAVIRVRTPKGVLPKPLDLGQEVKLSETMPVFILGFPFGEALSRARGNPAVTIGRGSVSSLREDAAGKLSAIQLDGDVNPGNSGGPVVDTKGRLVGITVAKILGSNIGMAIPARELAEMLEGRLSAMGLRVLKSEGGSAEIQVTLQFIDPLGKIAKPSVRFAPIKGGRAVPKVDKDGHWLPLPDAFTAELKLDGQQATGRFTVKLGDGPALITVQPAYSRGGDVVYAQPGAPYRVDTAAVPPETTGVGKTPVKPADITPADLGGQKAVKELGGSVGDVAVGGGGRYLVLHLTDRRQLAVFDVTQAKIVHQLNIAEDNIKFSAGMDVLVVALPKQKLLQRWKLATGEREATVPQPFGGIISALCMGSASNGPLLACLEDASSGIGAFLDPATFTRLACELPPPRLRQPAVFPRAGPDGTFFAWRNGVGGEPHEVTALHLNGGRADAVTTRIDPSVLLAGPGARHVYTFQGVHSNNLELIYPKPAARQNFRPFLPAHSPDYFLQIDASSNRGTGTVSFFLAGQERPFAKLDGVEGLYGEQIAYGTTRDPITFDKRVHFVPGAKVLVTLPARNDRLLLYPFDAEAALEKSGMDYLFVASEAPAEAKKGEAFTYPLAVKSRKGGLKYKVESAPKGVAVDDAGKVTWKVPADYDAPEATMVISVRDAGGQEAFHTFTLRVR